MADPSRCDTGKQSPAMHPMGAEKMSGGREGEYRLFRHSFAIRPANEYRTDEV
ncbi:hypothetical protein [Methanovulcanius yangii]|uniref:hypothetical protein n=1 Tax=Methanovulcanius yangii TaxID=1789227 RepID=UPI0029C9F8A2|nr:hypothetical protein [Methanovulcanius yangii]